MRQIDLASATDLHVETCGLGLGVNILLVIVERPNFLLKLLNPLDNRTKLTTLNSDISSTHGLLLVNTVQELAGALVTTPLTSGTLGLSQIRLDPT